jgi:tetratricopeptide (TPR) repeat protein
MAMGTLGNGLYSAKRYDEQVIVREAELSMMRRVGASGEHMLAARSNLANSHDALGQREEAVKIYRDVYSGRLKLNGKDHRETCRAASNYATCLIDLQRFEEAKSVLRKTVRVARRVLGENDETTIVMRCNYAKSLYREPGATLDDLREAVTTLKDNEPIARRVFGGAHPHFLYVERLLHNARAILGVREATEQSGGA